jgi:hypothetical protein
VPAVAQIPQNLDRSLGLVFGHATERQVELRGELIRDVFTRRKKMRNGKKRANHGSKNGSARSAKAMIGFE